VARQLDSRGDDIEFLLKDFEQWSNSYSKNEELGEKRVNFFTSVIAATFGGLGFLAENNPLRTLELYVAAAFAALVLLLFGILTTLRIKRRNNQTSHYLALIAELRQRLAPHWARTVSGEFIRYDENRRRRSLRNGGYVYVVGLLNSALSMIFSWAVSAALGQTPAIAICGALGSGLFAAIVHIVLLSERKA
jgi:hypothetical protein